jgi:hypothetical protein
MKNRLEKCLCGKNPRIFMEEEEGPGGPIVVDYYLECKCGVEFHGDSPDEKVLIKKWNKWIDKCKQKVIFDYLTTKE